MGLNPRIAAGGDDLPFVLRALDCALHTVLDSYCTHAQVSFHIYM